MSGLTRRRPRRATPRAYRPRGNPEELIHFAVVEHLRAAGVRFFHVPNGSRATHAYRAKLWKLGLSPGVPDLMIVDPPRGGGPGAGLELKAPKGRASDEQKQWLADLRSRGWATAIVYGLDEALAQLRAWGYLE